MRIGRRILTVIATAVVAWLTCPSAHANDLVVSDPAPLSEATERPGWVTLSFDESVDQDVVKVLVLDQRGQNRAVGDLVYAGSAVMMQLDNDLPKGTYTVEYRIDRADGQSEGGAFQFAYGKGKWSNLAKPEWSGDDQQPPEFETEGGNLPSVSTSPDPSPSAVPSAETTPTPFISASASATPQQPDPGVVENNALVWILLGVGIAALAGVGVVVFISARRRKHSPLQRRK